MAKWGEKSHYSQKEIILWQNREQKRSNKNVDDKRILASKIKGVCHKIKYFIWISENLQLVLTTPRETWKAPSMRRCHAF